MADTLYHALVLNLHQPHGNLEHLLQLDNTMAITETIKIFIFNPWLNLAKSLFEFYYEC